MRVLRLPSVLDRVGYSHTTLKRKMASGEFPRPIPLGGRAVGWLESDVDAWIQARIHAADRKSNDTVRQPDLELAASA